jgi:hypothetical protein
MTVADVPQLSAGRLPAHLTANNYGAHRNRCDQEHGSAIGITVL